MKIWNWLVGAEHTVEHILADFYSAVLNLEHLIEKKLDFADTQEEIIAKADEARKAALAEVEKAEKASAAIKALFS